MACYHIVIVIPLSRKCGSLRAEKRDTGNEVEWSFSTRWFPPGFTSKIENFYPLRELTRLQNFCALSENTKETFFCFQLERVTCLINRLEVPVPVPVRPKTSKPPNPLLVLKATVVLVLQSPMIKTENVSSRISVIACIRVPVQMVILLYCHNSCCNLEFDTFSSTRFPLWLD